MNASSTGSRFPKWNKVPMAIGVLLTAAFSVPSCQAPDDAGLATESLVFVDPPPAASVGRTPVSVDVDATGALTAAVPILVPAGRLGAQPNLQISYRSGSGDGSLGVGWSLSGFSRIMLCGREPTYGEPRRELRFDGEDPLCLDGRRLFLLSGSHGTPGALYRVEEGLERVQVLSGSPADAELLFMVIRPDASRVYYGGDDSWALTAHRYVEDESGNQQVASTPSTLAWLIRRSRDPNGNTVDYSYERTIPRDTSSPAAEMLPVRIDYPGFQPSPDDINTGVTTGGRRVELRYYEPREASVTAYTAGFPLLTQRVLRSIDTSGPIDSSRRWTLRHYDLEYDRGSLTRRPRLKSIRECDGHFSYSTPESTTGCLPATEFTYTDGDIAFEDAPGAGFQALPAGWQPTDPDFEGFLHFAPSYAIPYDSTGDGRDGVLFWSEEFDEEGLQIWRWSVRRSDGTSLGPAEPTSLPVLRSGFGLASFVTPLAVDLDHDGRDEIIAREPDPADPRARLRTTVWFGGLPTFTEIGQCSTFYSDLIGTMPAYVLDSDANGFADLVSTCVTRQDPDPPNPEIPFVLQHAWPLRQQLADRSWLPVSGAAPTFGLPTTVARSRLIQTYAVDLEGDGRHEVVMGTHMGWRIARSGERDGSVDAIALSTDHEYLFMDANGDGIRDAVSIQRYPERQDVGFVPPRLPMLHLGTGRGFLPAAPIIDAPATATESLVLARPQDFRVADLNSDGRDDLVLLINTGATRVFISTGVGFREVTSTLPAGWAAVSPNYAQVEYGPGWRWAGRSHPRSWPVSQFLDIDGDSRPDWMHLDFSGQGSIRTLRNTTPRPDLLVRVDDQSEGMEADYTTLGDRLVHDISRECPAGLSCPRRGGIVVARLRRGDGTGEFREWSYQYANARVDPGGRGFLGFTSVRVSELERGHTSERQFNVETRETVDGVTRFPFARIPVVEVTERAIDATYRRVDVVNRTLRSMSSGPGGGGLFVTRATAEVQASSDYRCASSTCTEALLTRVSNFVTQFDVNALPTRTSRVVDGGSRTDTILRRLTSTDAGAYRIGLVDRVLTRSYPNAADTSRSATRVVENTFDSNNQVVSTTVYNVAGARDSTLVYGREPGSMGQVTHIELSGFEPSGFDGTTWTRFVRSADVAYDEDWIFPRTATNSLGHVEETWIHPVLGLEIEHVDAAGDRSWMEYDGLGRIVRERDATGAGVDISYEESTRGWIDVRAEGSDGSLALSTLDHHGREIIAAREILSTGILRMAETTRTFDRYGRVVRQYNPRFDALATPFVQTDFDGIDRPTLITQQDGTWSLRTYTGRRVAERDFRGNRQVVTLDAELRFRSRNEGAGGLTTTYEYGFFGQLERVSAGGQVWTSTPGGSFQLPQFTTDPDAGRRDYLYNSLGEVRAERDASGNVSTVTRDAAGRVIRVDTTTEGATTWDWDGLDGTGRLDQTCSNVGTTRRSCVDYSYTSSGQVSREVRTIAGYGSLRTNYTYTLSGQLESITYPSATGARPIVRYDYDDAGMLARVEDGATASPYLIVRNRDAWGHTTDERFGSVTSGTGVRGVSTFDPVFGRPQRLESWRGTSGQLLQRLAYTYDANGNVSTRQLTTGSASAAIAETFTYDRLDRLTNWMRTGTPSETYGYDGLGNPTTMRGVAQTFGGPGYGPHQMRRGAGATEDTTYDDVGRVESSGPNSYTWTSFGLPASVRQGDAVTRYVYGPSRERMRRTGSAGEVTYAGDLYERRVDAGTVRQVFHVFAEGREIAQVLRTPGSPDSVAYLLTDILGSVATIASAAGAVLERHATNPWGSRLPGGGPTSSQYRHRFAGHEGEEGLGTVNMRGRIYDPSSGRFLSADPVTQSPSRAQGLNRYSYVFNNPSSSVDPTGMYCDELSFTRCPDGSTPGAITGDDLLARSAPDFFGAVTPVNSAVPTGDIFGITPAEGQLAGEYMRAGVLGFSEGALMGMGVAFGLGVIVGAGFPLVATFLGVGLLAYGAYELYTAYSDGSLEAGFQRVSSGNATPDDVYTISAIGGGLIGGGVAGPASFSVGAQGGLAGRALVGTWGSRVARGRYFSLPGSSDIVGTFMAVEQVQSGATLDAVFLRMMELQAERQVEVGLVTMMDGTRWLGTGGPDGILYPESGSFRWFIAHTHDTVGRGHYPGATPADRAMLAGQRSGYVVFLDHLGRLVAQRFWQ